MKRIFTLIILFSLAILVVSGCGNSSPSSSTSLDATTAATAIAQAIGSSCNLNSSLSNAGVLGQGAKAASLSINITTEADGWWYCSYSSSYGSYSESLLLHLKVWDSNSTLLDTEQEISELGSTRNLNKLYIYGTISLSQANSQTFSMTIGNGKTSPLQMEKLNTPGSATIDGSLTYSGSSNSETLNVSIDYNNLSLSASGYPSGSIDFIINYAGQTYAGSVTSDGTNIATLAFTSGLSASYSINLLTGAVSAI